MRPRSGDVRKSTKPPLPEHVLSKRGREQPGRRDKMSAIIQRDSSRRRNRGDWETGAPCQRIWGFYSWNCKKRLCKAEAPLSLSLGPWSAYLSLASTFSLQIRIPCGVSDPTSINLTECSGLCFTLAGETCATPRIAGVCLRRGRIHDETMKKVSQHCRSRKNLMVG